MKEVLEPVIWFVGQESMLQDELLEDAIKRCEWMDVPDWMDVNWEEQEQSSLRVTRYIRIHWLISFLRASIESPRFHSLILSMSRYARHSLKSNKDRDNNRCWQMWESLKNSFSNNRLNKNIKKIKVDWTMIPVFQFSSLA